MVQWDLSSLAADSAWTGPVLPDLSVSTGELLWGRWMWHLHCWSINSTVCSLINNTSHHVSLRAWLGLSCQRSKVLHSSGFPQGQSGCNKKTSTAGWHLSLDSTHRGLSSVIWSADNELKAADRPYLSYRINPPLLDQTKRIQNANWREHLLFVACKIRRTNIPKLQSCNTQ